MGQATRQPKYDNFWAWVDDTIEARGDAIDMLLNMLTDEQLDQLLAEIADGLATPEDYGGDDISHGSC